MGSKGRTMGRPTFLIVMMIFVLYFIPIAANAFSSYTLLHLHGRHLLQSDSNVSSSTKYPDRTVRVDPLDDLKKYRGGYNLTNKHYWSSTIFTGVYGYSIGMLWFLLGVGFGGFILFTSFFGSNGNKSSEHQKMRSTCDKQCHFWPLLVAFFFTVLAIVAIGLVLGGNAKFHSRARTVVSIIMETANEASETIYNTTGAMKDIRTTLEASNGSTTVTAAAATAGDATTFLVTTSQRLDSEAADIQRQASKNRRLIDKGLKIVYIITTVTISMNLVAVIALSVIGFLRLQRPLYWLITLCWLLTVLCWLFFGLYFFLDNFSSDTCTALQNFQQDPNNNSLSSILPCDELLSAKSVLSDVSAGIYNMVNEVNTNISYLQETSYQNLPYVCNPFSPPPEYLYRPDDCPAKTIRIGDIPGVLQLFTCSDDNNGNCSNGLISTNDFKTVKAYTSSIQNLLNAYPGMESLIECQSIKEAFSEIILRHCGPLKRYARMVWAGVLFLGVVMVFLVLLWSRKALHERDCHGSDRSMKLHSTKDSTNIDSVSV